MRTLNRPMFNWGGPVKEGIMHGIREPYRGGGAALVGNPVYPQTGGREHHQTMYVAGQAAGRVLPHIRRGWGAFKNIFGKTTPSTVTRGTQRIPSWGTYDPVTITPSKFIPKPWLERDPIYQIGKKVIEGKGLVTKPIKWAAKSLATPTGAAGVAAYMFWPDGTKKTKEELAAQGLDQHGPFDHTDKKKIKKAQAAFAEAQRDTRVQKYLDMMGYDRSKKTAVADALIDASKIVSDRGTLETKNITRDLISPIIQATSKRFDKPEQIREAVGLMSVKAAIQKDLEDPQVAKLRALQIESEQKKLSPGVGSRLMAYMASKKGKVKGDELVDFVRLSASDEGKNFTMVTDEQVKAVPGWEDKSAEEVISFIAKDDGVYMMGDTVIEVEGGKPTRIK